MARPRGSGLNVTWAKRRDGTRIAYFYDRTTGKFLGHDRDAAVAAMAAAAAPAISPEEFPEGSLGWLINRYLRPGSKFHELKQGTQDLYRGYLKWMKSEWGDLPISGIKASVIEDIKLSLRETPAKANQTLALFRIILGYAVAMEFLTKNPAERPGRLPPPKRHQVWEETDIERFLDAAPDSLRLAMALLLHTVQRPADMLAMTVQQVVDRDGRLWISLKQAKTDAWVDVPVHSRLEPFLRARLKEARIAEVAADGKGLVAGNGKRRSASLLLVPSPEGRLWSKRNFARAWDKALRRANFRLAKQLFRAGWSKEQVGDELGLRHRQRRDLRRTGIVRMAEAGATTPQIAAVSGHSIDYCQKILDTYLPRRSEVALGAIIAWEQTAERNKTIRLADHVALEQGPKKALENGSRKKAVLPAVAGGRILQNSKIAASTGAPRPKVLQNDS